jgi:hypothetical protein
MKPLVLLVAALCLGACSSGGTPASEPARATPTRSAPPSVGAGEQACEPTEKTSFGYADNPQAGDLQVVIDHGPVNCATAARIAKEYRSDSVKKEGSAAVAQVGDFSCMSTGSSDFESSHIVLLCDASPQWASPAPKADKSSFYVRIINIRAAASPS